MINLIKRHNAANCLVLPTGGKPAWEEGGRRAGVFVKGGVRRAGRRVDGGSLVGRGPRQAAGHSQQQQEEQLGAHAVVDGLWGTVGRWTWVWDAQSNIFF